MDFNQLLQNTLNDIAVKMRADIDENFRQKKFYNEAWPKNQLTSREGSMMIRKGFLRNSIQTAALHDRVVIKSSLEYANIHNNGGQLTVSTKMKKFFWAKHIEAKNNGDITSANQWKGMALKKVGSIINIPKRQFVGEHPQLHANIAQIVDHNMKDLNDIIIKILKP